MANLTGIYGKQFRNVEELVEELEETCEVDCLNWDNYSVDTMDINESDSKVIAYEIHYNANDTISLGPVTAEYNNYTRH